MSEITDDERTTDGKNAGDNATEANGPENDHIENFENSYEDDEEKKKISRKEKKWTCEDSPLWRIFMNSYIDQEKNLEKADKFDRREAAVLPRFPNVKSSELIPPLDSYSCFPLNTFNLEERARLPDKRNRQDKIRLWRNMKNDPSVDTRSFLPDLLPEVSQTDSGKWPGTWPCVKRDLARERRNDEKLKKRRAKGLLPCQEDTDSEDNPEVPRDDFADHKELGHARVPISCPGAKKTHVVDRSTGDHPGLVDGDYIVFFFGKRSDEESKRAYADVCLRGLKGMHLVELSDKRIREKTWKFCFYQAVVALLAKTQLRYKFAWSVNIDYIFDHAWMLFVHMGSINVKEKIRLDDVVVYNYKYSVELELVHEMKDAPRIANAGWNYAEKDLRTVLELERPELMKTREEIGWKKEKKHKPPPVHEATRGIEKWFDKLPDIYRNCILRTSKVSLAFWKDENFWYLFNPYRCDKHGLWNDEGYACIMKFCSKTSLRRHIMVLLLRAYSYEPESSLKLPKPESIVPEETKSPTDDESNPEIVPEPEESPEQSNEAENRGNSAEGNFTIQIYQMIYHCVQIHNVKLLQRKPPGARMERVKKKVIDDCGMDPLMSLNPCAQNVFDENFDSDNAMNEGEDPSWLAIFKITWARFSSSKNRKEDIEDKKKLRWHQFYVEEPLKLFTLWGEIHPTGHMFSKENRGKQIQACYVVCAGMTRIQAPEYWSPKTLDAVVMCGDRYYTMSNLDHRNIEQSMKIADPEHGEGSLGKNFKIGETLFEVNVLEDSCGRLYDKNGRNLWGIVEQMFLKHHFGILSCESSCLGIFKFCGSYYMMDANSVGPPLFQYGDGVAYLVRATSYKEFMKTLILTIGSNECSRFSISPIVIGNMIDLGTTDLRDRPGRMEIRKLDCPYDDDSKDSRRGKPKNQGQGKKTIDRVSCKKTAC